MNTSFSSFQVPAAPGTVSPTVAPASPAHSIETNSRYIVPMFPYPSGTLHIGHARNYAIADAIARIERMKGHDVLFPIGWDAFGLPAENAAIEKHVAPSDWTRSNISAMKKSLQAMDFSFDWQHELATCEPETYQFSQLFFVQMLKAGFIYRSETSVSWDPEEQTVLAREQVIDGRGWRSGAIVEERVMPSWTARVTAFADELLEEFDRLDWPETAKAIGRQWIGRQEDGTFRLHDWNLSRQRYWGCPVPIVECDECGPVPVPEEALPVVLPENVRLSRPGNPLVGEEGAQWRACACPSCGAPAQRSTETLDTFFDSAWYFLRYPSVGRPGSDTAFITPEAKRWMPVDHYIGGIEHASMHLIYARFFCKALSTMGYEVPREPFRRLTAQGLVRAPVFFEQTPQGERFVSPTDIDSVAGCWVARVTGNPVRQGATEKMSKSKKNGASIDAIMAAGHTPDAIRFALFFAGPFSQNIDWTPQGLAAAAKSLHRMEDAARRSVKAPGGVDPTVEQSVAQFVSKARFELERGIGLNVTIGIGLGTLAVMEKAIREHRGGESVRRGMRALLAGFFPVAPQMATRAMQAMDPTWRAESFSFAAFDQAASKAHSNRAFAIQANGRTLQAIVAPEFETQEQAVQWAFAHCGALARKIDATRMESIHWKPGRVLNLVGPAPAAPVPDPQSHPGASVGEPAGPRSRSFERPH